MIGYDIYLLKLGFHPVEVVPTLAQKRQEQWYAWGETVQIKEYTK